MNPLQSPRRGLIARVGRALGCSEGRVYTLVIGLVLAVTLAGFGWPSARTEFIAGEVPSASTNDDDLAGGDIATPPSLPPLEGLRDLLTSMTQPTTTTTPPRATPRPTTPSPGRDPNYRLPVQLRPVEIAVANVVRDGCSRLSLVNLVTGLVKSPVTDPVLRGPLLLVLTELYVACDQLPYPPTRTVCELDRQVNAAILSSPLGLVFQSGPPVIGYAVALLSGTTGTALGAADPLGPLLKQQLGCEELPQ